MTALILDSLEIHNFRAFDSLKIEKLGRVNLIVGKNNVGKSSVLEAIRLYASRGTPSTIWEISGARDKSKTFSSGKREDTEELLNSLRYLFYGYHEITSSSEAIKIGPVNSVDDTLSISIKWFVRVASGDNSIELRQVSLFDDDDADIVSDPVPRFRISIGENTHFTYSLQTSLPLRLTKPEIKGTDYVFVSPNGLALSRVKELWDNITLYPVETQVLAALAIIAPGIEGISIIGGDSSSARRPTPMVRIAGIEERLPIRILGDGMQRMLGIALALVNSKDGILLIDEIENGLHYSVQLDMWRLIFNIARNLNVQVFATTHSWDCIEAFQKAANEDTNSEGLLIRLEVKKSGLRVTLFDEDMLGVATEQQIEVR